MEDYRNPFSKDIMENKRVELTSDQQAIVDGIMQKTGRVSLIRCDWIWKNRNLFGIGWIYIRAREDSYDAGA